MSCSDQFPYQLYLVISESDCPARNYLDVAEEAIKGGVDIVQLREKKCSQLVFLEKALKLKKITDKYGVPLIINDDLYVAQQVNAAGIHVGSHDITPLELRERWKTDHKIIGYSIEYPEQLTNRQIPVCDYLGISPVFSTKTKTDTVTEWGIEGIRKIRALTNKPLIAIGNVNLRNIKEVVKAGADAVAVVSAICSAPDPYKAAYELKNEMIK